MSAATFAECAGPHRQLVRPAQAPRSRAVPAGARADRRRRLVRARRARPRRRGADRHHRVRRLHGAGGRGLPRRRPVPRAVRRPGPAARRRRAQRHRPGHDPAHRPRQSTPRWRRPADHLGRACPSRASAARSPWSATTAGCRPSPTRSGFVGIGLLVLPLLPVIGTSINGARIWVHLGSLSFQPGEIAKICLAIFFAGYLVVKRDALALAGRRFIGIDLPRGRDLGPILLDVGGQPRRPGLPARPRLVAAVLRPVRGAALRRDRAAELAGRRLAAVRRRRLHRLPALRPRPGAHRRLARTPTARAPDRAGPVRPGLGRHPRHAAGARAAPLPRRRSPTPTSSPPRSARSSA